MTVGGLLKWGTVAAGEFLTEPRYMEEIARLGPANWDQKNIEIVIGTKVINGNSGPPPHSCGSFLVENSASSDRISGSIGSTE